MTSKKVPKTCDFCAKDIKSEMAYNIKLSQRPLEYKKDHLVVCETEPDMCHECFMKICTNGFKPVWKYLQKISGKWETVDQQTKVDS